MGQDAKLGSGCSSLKSRHSRDLPVPQELWHVYSSSSEFFHGGLSDPIPPHRRNHFSFFLEIVCIHLNFHGVKLYHRCYFMHYPLSSEVFYLVKMEVLAGLHLFLQDLDRRLNLFFLLCQLSWLPVFLGPWPLSTQNQ